MTDQTMPPKIFTCKRESGTHYGVWGSRTAPGEDPYVSEEAVQILIDALKIYSGPNFYADSNGYVWEYQKDL